MNKSTLRPPCRAHALRAARKSQGYTQLEMGRLLGLEQQGYCNKESGQVHFRLYEALMLSELLNMPLETLFREEVSRAKGGQVDGGTRETQCERIAHMDTMHSID